MDLRTVLRRHNAVDVYGEWDFYDPAQLSSPGLTRGTENAHHRLIDLRFPYDATNDDDDEWQRRPYRSLLPRGGIQATPQFGDPERGPDMLDTWRAEGERVRSPGPRTMRGIAPVRRETIDEEEWDWIDGASRDIRENVEPWRRDWRESGMRDDWANPAGHGEPFAMGDYGTLRAPARLLPFLEREQQENTFSDEHIERRNAGWRSWQERQPPGQAERRRRATEEALREYSLRQGYGGDVLGQAGPAYGEPSPAYNPYDPEAGRLYDWPQTPDQFMGFVDNGHDDMFDDFGHMGFGGL